MRNIAVYDERVNIHFGLSHLCMRLKALCCPCCRLCDAIERLILCKDRIGKLFAERLGKMVID